MKKILILGGAITHLKAVEAANRMGYYTIVSDYLQKENSPGKLIADEALMYNIYDIEELTEYCKNNDVSGVLGLSIDPTQVPMQRLTENLNLPAFGNKEQVNIFNNKREFYNECVKNGLDIIQEYTLDDINNGVIEYPVLIKPTDSRASRGIYRCENKEELLKAIPLTSLESQDKESFIIQKYMGDYPNITVGYIVKDGEATMYKMGDIHCGNKKDEMDRHFNTMVHPSKYAEMYLKNVNDKVIKMLKNLNIKNAPIFFQGFVDNDTVRFYDPGIRLTGLEYERIYEKALNIDLSESLISYVMGGEITNFNKIKDSYLLDNKIGFYYIVPIEEGTIDEIKGLDIIKNSEYLVYDAMYKKVGDTVKKTGDHQQMAIGLYYLFPKDYDIIMNELTNIEENLEILNDKGRSMLLTPFDKSIITREYKDYWTK